MIDRPTASLIHEDDEIQQSMKSDIQIIMWMITICVNAKAINSSMNTLKSFT